MNAVSLIAAGVAVCAALVTVFAFVLYSVSYLFVLFGAFATGLFIGIALDNA